MVRVICDICKRVICNICGNKIDVKYKRFKLTGYEYIRNENQSPTLQAIYNADDVCEECMGSINDYISEIKHKDGD